jgi:hypothetical protein
VPRTILAPSPFVGAGAWRAVASRLPDAVAIDYGGVSGPDWYLGVARRIVSKADGDKPWAAVLHSGAGGFAPAIAAAATRLTGLIFVDAVLPYPGKSYLDNAPAALADRLRRVATDGLLAPWNRWFDVDPLPQLIPEPAARRAFARELPEVPFTFLEAVSPADAGWERLPAAYVRLSAAYEEEAVEAERRGWRVRRANLHHLAMVSDPAAIAALLADLTRKVAT